MYSLLRSFAFDFLPLRYTFLFFPPCSSSQIGSVKRGLSASLPLASVLRHHANHDGRKMMVEGKKYDSELIFRLAVAAYS